MRQNLIMGMSQQLGMTPQLARSIRLLQLSAQDLSSELLNALDENLMLEREDEDGPGLISVVTDQEESPYWTGTRSGSAPDNGEQCLSKPDQQDVHMQILDQADLVFADARERRIACEICAVTDDAGYLSTDLSDIAQRASEPQAVSEAEVEAVLHRLQRLEPIGFAARSLKECLLVQLEVIGEDGRDPAEVRLATRLVEDALEEIAAARWSSLAEHMGSSVSAVLQAVGLIRRLNPRPAANFAPVQYLTPDVYVDKTAKGWSIRLNGRALPQLRVNPEYARAVEGNKSCTELRGQLQEARWLLRSVQVRQDTLLATTEAIFKKQAAFLSKGDAGLEPLTLKEVADSIGVHESTLSRITSSKYVQTPRGTYSLKHFFPTALVANDGICASDAAVKAMIRRLVSRENGETPLRDADIAAIMARRGIKIARRTIAKYREALGIGSSKERQAARRMSSRLPTTHASPFAGAAA